MSRILFDKDDILVMRKKHPCSSDSFKVLRLGADIKIACTLCKRELMMPREKLEKMIKSVITPQNITGE